METQISSKWRNVITVKNLFEDDTTPELIAKLCDAIMVQLTKIKEKEAKSNLTADEKYNIDSKIEEVLDNFKFLKDFATGTIPESEWAGYSFNGDYEKWFNDYLEQLYDLGDERVLNTNNVLEKFIWIE